VDNGKERNPVSVNVNGPEAYRLAQEAGETPPHAKRRRGQASVEELSAIVKLALAGCRSVRATEVDF
jgi:hypothetical protein